MTSEHEGSSNNLITQEDEEEFAKQFFFKKEKIQEPLVKLDLRTKKKKYVLLELFRFLEVFFLLIKRNA